MNVFELVKTVLDEQYSSIEDDDKDQAVPAVLQKLSIRYKNLAEENKVTYKKPLTRFAYVYRYVTSHSNLVYGRIRNSKILRTLFESPTITVSCIGGGPGSDLLGILKYVSELEDQPRLRCHLLDGENGWSDGWSAVDEKLDGDCHISTYFTNMDVTDENSWGGRSKYLASDLFTMIYFGSEIYCRRKEAESFFHNLMDKMKPGALLLYVDNNDSRFSDWFDGLAGQHGIEIVEGDEGVIGMPYDEEKTTLGEYLEKFGPVKLDANVAWRIYRKPVA